jgi:hypothetical protein
MTGQPYSNGSFQSVGPTWNGNPLGYPTGVPVDVANGDFTNENTDNLFLVPSATRWEGDCWVDLLPLKRGKYRKCLGAGHSCYLHIVIAGRAMGGALVVHFPWIIAFDCAKGGTAFVGATTVRIKNCVSALYLGPFELLDDAQKEFEKYRSPWEDVFVPPLPPPLPAPRPPLDPGAPRPPRVPSEHIPDYLAGLG